MPTISVVMPSMNEESTIGVCIEKARKIFEHYEVEGEIIVVDNSTDSTPRVASSMGAEVIGSVKGYGNAYITGLSHAKGDYIVIADADGTYDFEEIPEFLDHLMNDEADFVIGSRLKGNIKKGSMPWLHQYVGNPFLTWLLNILFKANISDAHCGMRAFTKEALNRINLKTHGMELASEMVIEAAYNGLRIKEVPITYYPRDAPSNLRSFQDGWRHIRFMMLYHPVPFLYIPGAFVFLIGFVIISSLLLQGSVENRAHSFILGGMMIVIGGQILATGTYMKTYGIIHGVYKKKDPEDYKFLNYHSLEMELLTGAIILIAGLLLGVKVAWTWVSVGCGSMLEIEYAVLSMVFGAIGIQLVFSAIFLSVMLLDTDTDR